MGEFEDFIKAKYPVDYESLKEKYPNVPIVKFYGDEQDVWNHQQAKIEQLDKEKDHLAEMNKRYLGKMQEQQDQIASVKDVIKKHDRYIPQSTINALEKALRGES